MATKTQIEPLFFLFLFLLLLFFFFFFFFFGLPAAGRPGALHWQRLPSCCWQRLLAVLRHVVARSHALFVPSQSQAATVAASQPCALTAPACIIKHPRTALSVDLASLVSTLPLGGPVCREALDGLSQVGCWRCAHAIVRLLRSAARCRIREGRGGVRAGRGPHSARRRQGRGSRCGRREGALLRDGDEN